MSLPDPVVDVDVGKAIPNKIVKEWEVEEATLLPVLLGVGEDKMKWWHEYNVSPDKDQNWVVVTRSERVGEENEDKESANDLKKDREKENEAVEEGS